MKKVIALFLVSVFILTGCNSVSTRDSGSALEGPEIVILTNAGFGDEQYANVVRDQFAKAGFNPVISLQPDYASFRSKIDAGQFDVAITYWNTVTGSPDYAVRSVWHSQGALNLYGIDDPEIDRLIELGSVQTADEYVDTYEEYEKYLVEEKAYVIPMYVSIKTLAVRNDIMDPDSVRISKSRSMVWEEVSFKDKAKNDTEPFVMSQIHSDLTPLDPVRSDDGSTFMLITNSYIRLVNLTDTDEITTNSSLTRNYAISENAQDFYFLLRDDVNFCKVENEEPVDTGERVGGEDVVYSVGRMVDKDSVPDHKNYNNFENIESAEIYTDLQALKEQKTKEGLSILEVLQQGVPEVKALTDDKTKVDNESGIYQVVHLKTTVPFPQILNVLAHSSGGIVSQKAIEQGPHTYNPDTYSVTDVLYGDQVTYTEGPGYNNSLVSSGPFIAIKKNDYDVTFKANPGYMPNDPYAPQVKTLQMKFIKETDAALSSLRAGEIYILYTIPASKIELVNEDPTLTLKEIPGNAYNYMAFNFNGKFADEDLRKAALYAFNQEELSAVFNNRLIPTYSSITPVLQTGRALKADPEKSAEYLQKYLEKQN